MKNKETIVIIGGGLSGLAAAEKLVEKYNVIILEKDSILGGNARSFFYKGKWIPITYHHIMNIDKTTLDFIKKYNLEYALLWRDVNISFWFNGKCYPLTKPQHIFRFKPFNFIDKIRFIKLGLFCYLKQDWSSLRGEKADKWLKKFVGENITNTLFNNLAEIKFGPLSSVDIEWFGQRLHEASVNRDKYSYLTIGIHKLIECISNYIKRSGGKIMLNAEVIKIKNNYIEFLYKKRKRVIKADKIISCIPPEILANMSDLSINVKNKLKKIKYKSVISMITGSKQLISDQYWNVFIEPRLSFGGIFNHTALYPKGGINGEYLYYFFTYLNDTDDFYKLSEKEIKDKYIKDIKTFCPDFKATWTKLIKIKYATPFYSFNYENPQIKISKNVYLTGTYRDHPTTRTMSSALLSGQKTAEFILKGY
jgi:protoporphyrinogen oxidase